MAMAMARNLLLQSGTGRTVVYDTVNKKVYLGNYEKPLSESDSEAADKATPPWLSVGVVHGLLALCLQVTLARPLDASIRVVPV